MTVRLMPQGIVRSCDVADCAFSAFTVHTGPIPCPVAGCAGHLDYPDAWPHVCPRGHGAAVPVERGVETIAAVPLTYCPTCPDSSTRRP